MAYNFTVASSSSPTPIRYFVYGNVGPAATSGEAPVQILEVRLGCMSRLISPSPNHQILQETPSNPIANSVFPLSLRRFFQSQSQIQFQSDQPFLFQLYVVQILCSLNLHATACDAIARKIVGYVAQLAGGNSNVNLHVVAAIDYIIPIFMLPMEGTVLMDEVPAERRRRGASVPVPELEELELGEEEDEELGDCSICLDQLEVIHGHGGSGKKKKVVKIGCGHVYHKSCILTWLANKNSCPLCRAPLFLEEQ